MSPKTAKLLYVGQYVALRGEPDHRHFTHVAQVTKKTGKTFTIEFPPPGRRTMKLSPTNKQQLRGLRLASPGEAAGYSKVSE